MMNKTATQKQPKFNWGTGLTIAILLFIAGTLSTVGFIISLDFDMVTENHYEKAVNYQEHINRIEHAGALREPVKIIPRSKDGVIQILFPSTFVHKDLSGVVELYRPGDSDLDQKTELRLDDKGAQYIATQNLAKGKWVVKVSWSSGDQDFYQQENIFL